MLIDGGRPRKRVDIRTETNLVDKSLGSANAAQKIGIAKGSDNHGGTAAARQSHLQQCKEFGAFERTEVLHSIMTGDIHPERLRYSRVIDTGRKRIDTCSEEYRACCTGTVFHRPQDDGERTVISDLNGQFYFPAIKDR